MSAELAARRTAARAVLGDYLNGPGTADPDELSLCAARLADALSHVLAVLDEGDQAAAQFLGATSQDDGTAVTAVCLALAVLAFAIAGVVVESGWRTVPTRPYPGRTA
jgi:hypothetical protein